MFESEWWETAVGELEKAAPADRPRVAAEMLELYRTSVGPDRREKAEVQGLIADMIRHLESPLPPFMVISAPDGGELTPDDLVVEPAWNPVEVERLWGVHDGRSLGTMVVGIYRLDRQAGPLPRYVRTDDWGILGDARKTGPAAPEDTIA